MADLSRHGQMGAPQRTNRAESRLTFVRRFLGFPVVLVLGVTLGCSGGGGGASRVDFSYLTDWANTPTGRSQVVTLSIEGGGLVSQGILNNTAGGVGTLTVPSLKTGDYILAVSYTSQQNGGGVVLGELSDRVHVTGSAKSYSSIVGQPVSRVEVHPSTATIAVQESIQLHAVGYDASDVPTFVAPGGWDWDSLNGNASVNDQGIVVGEAAGSAQIRATHLASGFFNSSVITVTPFNATRTKWTVMVFLNAANDLDQFSDLNVNQMERAANGQLRFIVQWKRSQALGFGAPWSGTRRYRAVSDTTNGNAWANVKSELIQDMGEGVDMGSADTLRDFITWTQTYYPADRYVLVLWNHGAGWRTQQKEGGTRGFSFDDEFGTHIKTWELKQALVSPEPIQILSWDASLMQMLEVGYEVKDSVSYMVGAEVSPPAEGLPYDLVFAPLKSNPDLGTEAFLPSFGAGMLQYYGNTRRITESSVRTSALTALATTVSSLGQQLISVNGLYDVQVSQARSGAENFRNDSNGCYVDLVHVAQLLKQLIPNGAVDNACDAVMNAVTAAVVHEAHNNLAPNAHGISIEFGDMNRSYWSDYQLLDMSANTLWDEWLMQSPP